jgi:m7GpppX diphosphatase
MAPNLSANAMITRFKFHKLLNQDQGGRRIILQGTIGGQPALLIAERAAFGTEDYYLSSFSRLVANVNNLGENDIYRWYMVNSLPDNTLDQPNPPDIKINLIYPCTDKHIKKYSFQQLRSVTETPDIYRKYVQPYMRHCREEGRLNWVFNIIEGRSEQENVLYRSEEADKDDNYLLIPDLNWDRSTVSSLHLLAIVERRDIWSVRDLQKKHVPWLRQLRSTLIATASKLYEGVEEDMLKFYVHYQPTYYHFHIHIVHVNLDPNATQALGKAMGLENVISQLETMDGVENAGMKDVELTYTIGEESELWSQIFKPLKEGKEPEVSN